MKKVFAWLLIITLLFGCADLTGLKELLPKQSAYAEEPSGARYRIYFSPRRLSIESDFSDLSIDFFCGDENVGSWKPHDGAAFWDEESTTMAFDKIPTKVVISCRYLVLSEYLQFLHEGDFAEGLNTQAVDMTHPAGSWFGSYSIVEDTAWYVDLDGNIQKPSHIEPASRTPWVNDWYYLGSSLTINYRFTVYNNVNLILADGATLAVNGGLELGPGGSLTVWGQKYNTGCLRVSAGDYDAGIGGSEENSCGELTVNGGTVIAYGGEYAAGVGGGQYGSGGDITVNGGTLEAHGGELGAGVGGGEDRSGGTVTVNGGTLKAYGGHDGAGIGGGDGGSQGGAVQITGGKVEAVGGSYAAGIGGGQHYGGGGDGGYVNITGGEVYAECGSCAAGIGGGFRGKNGEIEISGGIVEAHGSYGAAIGSGYDSAQGGEINILGGHVMAISDHTGAGIGGGSSDDDGRDGGTINISNALVLASSLEGAGIGGGGGPRGYDNGGNGGSITIIDSIVTAVSLAKGAGIGGGNDGNGGNITISGGTVIASGGHLEYSYIAENEHVGASIHGSASGIKGGMNAGQGTMDSYCYDKIADFVIELIFSGEYGGAGIGGGDDGDGGTVTISGGAGVFANAGMNTARAIGRGDGGDRDGSLTLYDTAAVSAGPKEDSLTRIESAKRVSACQSQVFTDITPCDHPDVALEDYTPYQHRLSCKYCVGEDRVAEENHRFDKETRLCACGHAQHAVNLGIYGDVMAALSIDGIFYEESPQYLSAGANFTVIAGGSATVTASYKKDGETHTLEPDKVIPAPNPDYGWGMYEYDHMPDADVDIKVVREITSWKGLRNTLIYALDGSRIVLPRDLTARDDDEALVIPAGKTLTLDLNGHKLNRGLSAESDRKENGQVMAVYGDLTLEDGKGGGKLTGGFNSSPNSAGGVDVHVGAKLRMHGGEISGNGTEKGLAGGVFVDEGAQLSLGGSVNISGNTYRGAASNVVLAEEDARIAIDGTLSDSSTVGVGSLFRPGNNQPLVVTQGLGDRGSISSFVSDDAQYKVVSEDGEAALRSLPEFSRAELELGGTLNMRFYMKYPDGWDPTGDRMEFSVNGLKTRTVPYDASATGDGKDYFACPVNAYQMADTIKAEYYYAGGKAAEYEYTVKQYLSTLLSPAYRQNLSAEAINLAQATANYGHYIQPYLAENNGWTVGVDHAEMDLYNAIPYSGNPAGEYGFVFQKAQAYFQNVKKTEFYLTLDADTLLNVRVYLENGDDIVTGKVGTQELRHWKRAGSSEVVCLEGIPANALGIPYAFRCYVNGTKVFDLRISALSYVNLALGKGSASEKEKMAFTALYNYAMAAAAYSPPTA